MSKKDKSKFRRRLRAEILKQMSQSQAAKPSSPVAPAPVTTPAEPVAPVAAKAISQPVQPSATVATASPVGMSAETLGLIRHDLKKSAIIIGSIILLIVVLYLVDLKTGILLKAGNEIFKVLHIGAQ